MLHFACPSTQPKLLKTTVRGAKVEVAFGDTWNHRTHGLQVALGVWTFVYINIPHYTFPLESFPSPQYFWLVIVTVASEQGMGTKTKLLIACFPGSNKYVF
jgi:hypothetical protein